MIVHGPIDPRVAAEWRTWFNSTYTDRTPDDAFRSMFHYSLEHILSHQPTFQFVFWVVDDKPVGLIKYKTVDPTRIELWYLAVLPEFRRQGIASSLLEEIKKMASGKAAVFASGLLEPSHRPLQKAGFWPCKPRRGEVGYKWSDLQAQMNDDTPECDEKTGWSNG